MISLPWGESQCREVIDLLTMRAKGQIEMARLVPRDSIARDMRPDFEARAEFLGGLAMDLMRASVQPQEREDDLEQLQDERRDPGGVDA